MKKYLIITKVSIVFLVFSGLLSFSYIRNASRTIQKTEIKIDSAQGNYFLKEGMILEIYNSGLDHLEQTQLTDLEIKDYEKWVKQNPFVKDAEVYYDIDGKLYSKIVQKLPIARIQSKKESYYLSKEGRQIPLSDAFSAKVILIQGEIQTSEYKNLVELIQQIHEDKLLKKHIIGITKQSLKSFYLIGSVFRYKIHLGDLTNLENKLKKLKIFYEQHMGKVPRDYYKKIDLSYKKQVVATKRESNDK